jgi:hypothetical protein
VSAQPEDAAYHEAGHCYLAVRDAGRVVDWMCIYEEEEGWGGKTHIQPDFQSLLSWTTIAVAGIVAEARADANRRFSRNERLVIADQLVEEVKRYVDDVLIAARKKQTIKPVQITFRTSEGNEGVSSMSPDDVHRMPPQYRDRWSLRTAMEGAEKICHDPGHWEFIEKLSQEVIKTRDYTLYRDAIETILGLR